eukprot:g5751.t1
MSLAELSAQLTAADPPSSAFKQVTFAGTTDCPEFVPNPFKKDMCRECHAKLIQHFRAAIKEEKHVKAAVEWLSKKPSVVFQASEPVPAGSGAAVAGGAAGGGDPPSGAPALCSLGPLFLGGFKAAMD